jgi:hypothetical protein
MSEVVLVSLFWGIEKLLISPSIHYSPSIFECSTWPKIDCSIVSEIFEEGWFRMCSNVGLYGERKCLQSVCQMSRVE